MNSIKLYELGYGNCDLMRDGGEEAYAKDVSLRTETCYKADSADELAQHSEVLSSVLQVKHEVVHWNIVSLLGEASFICAVGLNLPLRHRGLGSNTQIKTRGVSRGHSSSVNRDRSNCLQLVCSERPVGLRQDEGPNLWSGGNQ